MGVLSERSLPSIECASSGIVTETAGSDRRIGEDVGMSLLCYRRHRFPAEIIQHAIWLYLRFTLSYRDVEERLCQDNRIARRRDHG